MELALNIIWAVSAICLLGATYHAARRGAIRVSVPAAILTAMLLAFVLLPVISISDDFLDARQAALPLSGQSWRLATEGSANGLDQLVAFGLYLIMIMSFLAETRTIAHEQWCVRRQAAWLAQSQRLRPPPALVAV